MTNAIKSLELDLLGIESEIKKIMPIECTNDNKYAELRKLRAEFIKAIDILKIMNDV